MGKAAREIIYRVSGRALVVLERCYGILSSLRGKGGGGGGSELDKTGRFVKKAEPLKVLWEDSGVIFADFHSISHSFWRAQELSLFSRQKENLQRPMLDFGCGDGSFATVMFKEVDYGVDHDEEAMKTAQGFGTYGKLVLSTSVTIPMEDSSVRSIISNSVFEHLSRLDEMFSELYRVTASGGTLMFTVPVVQFKEDLARYFGRAESERVNREYYHRNLLEPRQWEDILQRHGFSDVRITHYQPGWFTYWYKMLRVVGLVSAFYPGAAAWVWKRFRKRLTDMVRDSIENTESGGNIFVTAKKP